MWDLQYYFRFILNVRPGGSLPLILMHTRALQTYLSGGYLPCIKDYRVWYFSNEGKWGGNDLNIPYFTSTAKENWKEGCNSINALNYSFLTCRQRTSTPHWLHWFSNVQASQPAKLSIQSFFNRKLPLFIHQHKPYPRPATPSNCFHIILHVLTI